MKRRDFLKMLPALGVYLGSLQQAIGRELQDIIGNRPSSLTISSGKGRREISLPVSWQSGVGYVSADRFAKAFDYNTYLNQQKRKLVIYFPNNKVVVSADNPFVVIDSKVYQMPSACQWANGGIQVPIAQLIPLTNSYTNTRMEFDKARFILGARKKAFSVAGIDMSSKANGDVIRIRTSRRFRDGEITSNMRNGWLHVDLYGATADVELLKKTKVSGHVRELNVFEFRKLISVALRLRKEPLSREVYQDKSNGDVVVVLRYKEEIAQNEKRKEPEDPRPKKETANNEDLSIDKQLERERERWLIDTVVIDAGHGGRDPGAIGVGGIREKDLALAVALKLGALVKRKLPDVRVVYTRKDDRFIELRRRTQIANENKAKVFISIHANANRSSRASGFETYLLGEEKGNQARNVMERENSVIKFEDPGSQKHYQGINSILVRMTQAGFQKQSEHLASSVQQNMAKRLRSLNMKNRGVKQAPFWVMVGASMPSILVEMGFITNKHESKILKTASHQQKIAEGIFTGLSGFKKDYESAI
ncbi:MAG: N-acetylmuramoyl-L-alanine amidase family protein [Calditrichia bacterium]